MASNEKKQDDKKGTASNKNSGTKSQATSNKTNTDKNKKK